VPALFGADLVSVRVGGGRSSRIPVNTAIQLTGELARMVCLPYPLSSATRPEAILADWREFDYRTEIGTGAALWVWADEWPEPELAVWSNNDSIIPLKGDCRAATHCCDPEPPPPPSTQRKSLP
jgi:hypothetical protein